MSNYMPIDSVGDQFEFYADPSYVTQVFINGHWVHATGVLRFSKAKWRRIDNLGLPPEIEDHL